MLLSSINNISARFLNFSYLQKSRFFIVCISVWSSIGLQAQSSVLSKGDWYKIATTQTGVYKINAGILRKAGIDISKVNPQNIRLYGNGGAMLPQANNTTRPTDLKENAIEVAGENDGKFDEADYILFYAESPHTITFDAAKQQFSHQQNYYSDTTFYFLTIADTKGLRVGNAKTIEASTTITTFDDFRFHESDLKNLISSGIRELGGSGREWYGEPLGNLTEVHFDETIEGLVPNSTIKIKSAGVSAAYVSTQLGLKLNGNTLGNITFAPIRAGQYDAKGIYDLKGTESAATFTSTVSSGNSIKLTYAYNKAGQSTANAYLNYYEIQSKRNLQFYESQTLVRSLESMSNPTSRFRIAQASAQSKIWDVTNPQAPENIPYTLSGSESSFGVATGGVLKTFALFTDKNLLEPNTIEKTGNQNLHNVEVPDLLIITLPEWKNQAQRLADFRTENDGLSVLVATAGEVYNEFASGKPDVSAIRDFARFLWLKKPGKLKYLLLFGDATYDYKNNNGFNYVNPNLYIPTYESRESLNPVFSFSSDDYFGFLETHEGDWAEDNQGNHTLDIGVGRLPAKTADEAGNMIDKLIYYAQNNKTIGKWRGKISFVADDGDGNIHQSDADRIAALLETQDKNVVLNKIYLDNYKLVGTPIGTIAPEANKALNKAVNEGSLIVNYSGHGGPDGWTEEKILTIDQIDTWKNLANMPLFLTATCSFGRFDDPSVVSGAELALLSPRGAAIGLLTTTRPVYSYTNFLLNNAFYSAFVLSKQNPCTKLGDVFRITKNNSLSHVNNRNFSLLGDPSMKLAYPADKVIITKINNQNPETQTLKALAKVKLEGEVRNPETDQLISDYNGYAQISVFDKPSTLSTLGQKTDKFRYQAYQNKIYEGRFAVKNGVFSADFIVPKDINYQLGQGKINCYAFRADSSSDAIGSFINLWVGGSAPVNSTDTKGPEIELFVDKNNVLTASIFDENGINLSQAGIGHEMLLTLNDTLQTIVNQYFTNTADYTKGELKYALGKLPTGKHTIKLKIWDTYNNSTEATLAFLVDNDSFRLLSAYNYPNPFQETTSFVIQHNADGEDLNFYIEVFEKTGKKIYEKQEQCYACLGKLNIEMTLRSSDLISGTYFYRITAGFLNKSGKTSASGKLLFWK
ncbi:type IX secretion system sortase PorU [Emticicia sp. 21SJ11W-3]|uniref:type IX secretion system sortase PorU n=1 Tax=Emticicia sp. 21SJ11W-3 TaxID=2916755 RepID=UPI0020A1BB67|nr:type IX secretion system sortase PorU [Emticicia sp. 21SJ11W-3]UTA68067.1 type IX secretion system sortase PorU [Emticicia sp. 21SJ11W-3]